ncbi:hypothetical protein PSTG_12736 [Puccinia striiformis f. sp. tritici PST-78]|uniref:Uncharacterized protein n=1 Tax=Puccinia striiformis f. sp. tritici PST-78 TaxID=1165861 RepID=A0A0L0V3P7_9BASI|nr:hypothetical protein PSTG_12736 [Puccinia striiformis f. sp. tritici PST-78]
MTGLPNRSPPATDTPPQSPTFPTSFRQFHIPSRLTEPVPQSPPPSVPQSPPANVTRVNAIRRRPQLELKDIEINGERVCQALGLTPTPSPTPSNLCQTLPAVKPSPDDCSTRPPPPISHPFQIPQSSSLPRKSSNRSLTLSRRRRGLIVMIPADLPQELRDIQIEASMTQDDPT